jgi:hypothetical protein
MDDPISGIGERREEEVRWGFKDIFDGLWYILRSAEFSSFFAAVAIAVRERDDPERACQAELCLGYLAEPKKDRS